MRSGSPRSPERGFTYVFLLFLVAVGGILLAVTGQLWSLESRRYKEEELLFAGRQIRNAIETYHRVLLPSSAASGNTGDPGDYPRRLEDLLEDNRRAVPVRHLRRIYIDPMTGTSDWGLVYQGDRIVGVYSKGTGKPLRTAGFLEQEYLFQRARSYGEWRFVATGATPTLAPAPVSDVPATATNDQGANTPATTPPAQSGDNPPAQQPPQLNLGPADPGHHPGHRALAMQPANSP